MTADEAHGAGKQALVAFAPRLPDGRETDAVRAEELLARVRAEGADLELDVAVLSPHLGSAERAQLASFRTTSTNMSILTGLMSQALAPALRARATIELCASVVRMRTGSAAVFGFSFRRSSMSRPFTRGMFTSRTRIARSSCSATRSRPSIPSRASTTCSPA